MSQTGIQRRRVQRGMGGNDDEPEVIVLDETHVVADEPAEVEIDLPVVPLIDLGPIAPPFPASECPPPTNNRKVVWAAAVGGAVAGYLAALFFGQRRA